MTGGKLQEKVVTRYKKKGLQTTSPSSSAVTPHILQGSKQTVPHALHNALHIFAVSRHKTAAISSVAIQYHFVYSGRERILL
jgi:hypothetical protein